MVNVDAAPSHASASPDPESVLVGALADVVHGVADDDETSARILDAAYEVFCRIGTQRATMEDVARLAGVSRITVYRRFATKPALVDQVVRREIRRFFDQFRVDIEQAKTAADRVVLGFVSALHAIRRNPLIGGLMAVDPNALVPATVADGGRTLATVRAFVAGQLRIEQEAGNVSPRRRRRHRRRADGPGVQLVPGHPQPHRRPRRRRATGRRGPAVPGPDAGADRHHTLIGPATGPQPPSVSVSGETPSSAM